MAANKDCWCKSKKPHMMGVRIWQSLIYHLQPGPEPPTPHTAPLRIILNGPNNYSSGFSSFLPVLFIHTGVEKHVMELLQQPVLALAEVSIYFYKLFVTSEPNS